MGLLAQPGPYWASVFASPPSIVMMWTGLCRYSNAPCGPDAPKSTPSGNTFPCRTRLAAWATFSALMKFDVPSSSSSPQRPQLLTSRAARRKSVMLAMGPSFLKFTGHFTGDAGADVAAVDPDDLARNIAGRTTIQEDQHSGLFGGLGDP